MSFLPEEDREYLASKRIVYEEVVDGTNKGLVLKTWSLPDGLYDHPSADILIILPSGYPDVPPDMFHLMPWVRLALSNSYPKAADQPVNFAGQKWQRWSRHNNEWRPGVDGIWTMIKRVSHALEKAA